MPRLILTDGPNNTFHIFNGDAHVINSMPAATARELANEILRRLPEPCPCTRGQKFIDRKNTWEIER